MRSVEFKLGSTDDKTVDYEVVVERRNGDIWTAESRDPITSGTPEAEKKVILEDGMRLTIIAQGSETELVWDKEQNAAMPRHAFESQPTLEERHQMEKDRQAELRHRQRRETKTEAAARDAAAQARDKVLQESQKREAEATQQKQTEKVPETTTTVPTANTVSPSKPPVAPAKPAGK